MKKLFKAIRDMNFELVLQLIDRNPGLVNCTAKQPPKKDDGQSPLQIAVKSGAFDIAELLIDRGADLNFIEDILLQSGSDVNRLDSYGNSGIWRFCSQASQILPYFNSATNYESNDRSFTTELETDLLNILNLLCKYGADMNYVQPNIGLAVKEYYTGGAMAKLLAQVE